MNKSYKVLSIVFPSLIFVCSANASGKKTPQQTLDEITSRPGEVKGVVIKQTPNKVTVLEQPYGKPAVEKTYEKKK